MFFLRPIIASINVSLFLTFAVWATGLNGAENLVSKSLQPFVDSKVLAGAVTLVADKEKVLSVETVGYSDIGQNVPMKEENLFWIASMSKPITGCAMMILVDEGKVSLDDPVEKFLPEFKGQMVVASKDPNQVVLKKPSHPITIKNVLNHTSGLPFKSPIENPTLDLYPLATRVQSYAMMPLDFEPDTKYQYSNCGINTAGRIIEIVSGKPYEEFVKSRIFDPLGMKDTVSVPNAAQIRRIAKSYKGNRDKSDIEETQIAQLKYPLDDVSRQPMPAGGFFSSARDVGQFARMVLNGGSLDGKRILSEKAVKTMTSKQTGNSIATGYGVGFSTNGKTCGHGGAYSTNMTIDFEKGLVLVFMVQNAGWRNDDGKKVLPAFMNGAYKSLGK
jgi:CubicO group peptidase (beta-lactamase class C family)